MENELLGSLELDFLINNPELMAELKKTEDSFQASTAKIEGSVAKANTAIQQSTLKSTEALKLQAAQYQQIADLSVDPKRRIQFNQLAEQTATEAQQMANAGKKGFDELGNAVGKSTNYFTKAYSWIRQIAYALPGVGVAGIIAFAAGPIIEYIAKLDLFSSKLTQSAANFKAFNEANKSFAKDAGEQISKLKILYQAATDVNNSMTDRIRYAQELKATYPDSFANSTTQAILNGKEADSYKALTDQILAQAKAKAVSNQIGEIEEKKINAEITKRKIDAKYTNDLTAYQAFQKQNAINYQKGSSFLKPGSIQDVANAQKIKDDADAAYKVQNDQIKLLDGQEAFLIKYAGGSAKVADALTKGNELIQDPLKDFDTIIKNASSKSDLDNLQKALQAKLDALAPNDKQRAVLIEKLRQLAEIEQKYSPKTTTDPSVSLLASQKSVLADLDALKAKYATNDKTREQQAQDAIIADFKQRADAIDTQNVKYTNYLKTHTAAQAKAAGLAYIDPAQLKPLETDALSGLAGNQSLEGAKNQIAEQKALFKEYQDYKLKAGTEAANQLYGNELNGYKTYIEYLQSLQPTEADLNSDNAYTKARASALSDYLKKELPAAQLQEAEQQKKAFQDLLLQNVTYQQQRQAIIENGIENENKLREAGYADQAAQSIKNTEDELTQKDEAYIKSLDVWKDLFDGVHKLSADQSKKDISDIQTVIDAALKAGTITKEAYEHLNDTLKKTGTAIKDKSVSDIEAVSNALINLANSVTAVNPALAELLIGLGNIGNSVVNVMRLSAAFKDAQNNEDKFAAGVNLVEAGVSAAVNLIDIFTSSAKQRKEAEQDYYDSVIASQNEYNLALDEQIRLQYKAEGNIFIENYAKELQSGAAAYKKASGQYSEALQQLSQGQAITGKKNAVDGKSVLNGAASGAVAGFVLGGPIGAAIGGIGGAIAGLFGGKKKVNALTPLLEAYPQLIKANGEFDAALAKSLVTNNQVDNATKVLLNNVTGYYEEEKAALDQINDALTALVGDLGSAIENNLVSAFEAGTDAFTAFKDAVSQGLGDLIKQMLFDDIFAASLDKLNDDLKATALSGGATEDYVSDIMDFLTKAGPLAQQYTDTLAAAESAGKTKGLDIFPSSNSNAQSSSLSGQVKGITETQANALEGIGRGMQLQLVKTSDLIEANGNMMKAQQAEMQKQTLIQMQIAANTKRTADNTDTLPEMRDSLKSIDKNTGDTTTSVLRGFGLTRI